MTLPLKAWLASAQDQHADQPRALATELLARAATLPTDAEGAAALRLAEHVMLAHLADADALAAFLAALPGVVSSADGNPDLPPADAGTAAFATARERAAWAHQVLVAIDRLQPDESLAAGAAGPPLAQRWRALQNLVLALVRQGRWASARAWLLAPRQAALDHPEAEARQAFAASANNVAGDLRAERRAEAVDLAARDALMLDAAAAAREAWAAAGTWLHIERADYQLALCHAAAGDGQGALCHAAACLARCEAEGADAVEHFFAHEALAQAHAAAADAAGRDHHCMQMHALLATIDDAGLQDWCRQTLAAVPPAVVKG